MKNNCTQNNINDLKLLSFFFFYILLLILIAIIQYTVLELEQALTTNV